MVIKNMHFDFRILKPASRRPQTSRIGTIHQNQSPHLSRIHSFEGDQWQAIAMQSQKLPYLRMGSPRQHNSGAWIKMCGPNCGSQRVKVSSQMTEDYIHNKASKTKRWDP